MTRYRSPRPAVDIPDGSLHDLAAAALDRRGDGAAFVDSTTGAVTTGSGAADSVRRAAAGFRRLGVQRGDVVCLAAPNSTDWPVAFLAALAAGATVTTANPMVPAASLARQLRLTRTHTIVTTATSTAWAREAAGTDARIVAIGGAPGATATLSDLLACDPVADPVPVSSTDLACLLASSGTTGLPKAVMLTHANLVAAVVLALDAFGELVDAADNPTFLGLLPYFHIAGLASSLLAPVFAGRPVVIQSGFELEELCRTVQDHRVTFAVVVPPIALGLARHPVVDRYDMSSLRLLCVGAAPMGADLETECARRLGCSVNQAYGMTEAVPISMSRPDLPGHRPGTVGTVVAGTELRLVDPDSGEDVAPGESGELWVRGPQVMAGYLGDPDATAATVTADGWLRTGDLCTVDAGGIVTVADRLKELIKVNAMQVAPAELEAVLLTHPAVADCAVVARPHDRAGEVPVAYVVTRGPIDMDDVKGHVAGRVPTYARLADVVVVDEIPKSPTGKILRRVLAERERAGGAAVPAGATSTSREPSSLPTIVRHIEGATRS